MGATKLVRRAVSVAALSATLVGIAAGAAEASSVPPKADNVLLGTWVNTNPNTNSVKQVDITANRDGSVSVDAFGKCTPTLCEWGSVPAIVYGPNVSAASGAMFQSNQAFYAGNTEWSRTTLLGTVVRTASGAPQLKLRELTVFEDGSARKNYTRVESFAPGEGQAPATSGNPVSDYRMGTPPALAPGAMGHWVAPTPNGGLVEVDITGTTANPVVHAYGQCSPSACDWGTSNAITFGDTVSSTKGRVALAPYSFGFKNAQLTLAYRPRLDKLVVSVHNEFTDGSGRSNYSNAETLVRG